MMHHNKISTTTPTEVFTPINRSIYHNMASNIQISSYNSINLHKFEDVLNNDEFEKDDYKRGAAATMSQMCPDL